MNLTRLILTTTLAIFAVSAAVQGTTHRGNQTHVTTFGNRTNAANAAPRPTTGRPEGMIASDVPLPVTNMDQHLERRLLGSTSGSASGSASCTCGGDDIYSYETKPISTNIRAGIGCIGGCGGDKFTMHRYMTTVRTLRVWTGGDHNGFRAIGVSFFNGEQQTVGSTPSSGPNKSFTFAPGEFLDGVVTLSGNDYHPFFNPVPVMKYVTRAGYLAFKTNMGHTFSAGKMHTPYYFEATGSFLAGFFGHAGTEVDLLGLLLFKPVNSIQITDVKYPTLDNYLYGLTPSQIVERPFCNDGPVDQYASKSATITVGTKSVWSLSVTASFEVSETIEVAGGVPEVEDVKSTTQFKWGVSATGSYSMETKSIKTKQQELKMTFPPHSRGYLRYTQFDSNINVPWEGVEHITFKDGSHVTKNVNGMYQGVYVSQMKSDFHIVPCNPCGCGGSPSPTTPFSPVSPPSSPVSPPSPNPQPSPMPSPSPAPAPSASGCRRSCIGLVFGPKSSRAGQAVCAAELCNPHAPYVDVTGFGCSPNPTLWKSTCCDTRLC